MATQTEIEEELAALATHCPPRLMDVTARVLWMRDWCNDLREFPIEAIRKACTKYRNSEATRFPPPHALKAMIRLFIPNPATDKILPWRPLNDEEYEALSIREKRRHHLIMAHEAAVKAGPMWKQSGNEMRKARSGHLTPDQMPETWAHWNRAEAGHKAEAKRLYTIIREAEAKEAR